MKIIRDNFNVTAEITQINIYLEDGIVRIPVKFDKENNTLILIDLYPADMQARITEFLKEQGYNIK